MQNISHVSRVDSDYSVFRVNFLLACDCRQFVGAVFYVLYWSDLSRRKGGLRSELRTTKSTIVVPLLVELLLHIQLDMSKI